jgi:hypothetical protein
MRSEEIRDFLAEIDTTYPTAEWTVGELHALPLVRYEVYNRNHTLYHRVAGGAADARRRAGRFGRLAQLVGGEARAWARRKRAEVTDHQANASLRRPVDAILYTDGVSFVELLGKKYDRFCDPLRDRLESAGASSRLLTPLHDYATPRRTPSAFIQPAIERARMRGLVESRLRRVPTSLAGYDALRRARPDVELPTPEHLVRGTIYIEVFADLYRRMLECLRPRVVYIVCYYGAERAAMLVAARQLGIPTVDIQHGYSGDLHWAYSRWANIPAGGFELLPDYFWCWSEDEHRSMSSWADTSRGAHRALVGGNLFADMWRESEPRTEAVRLHDELVVSLLRRHAGRPAVLYAANGLEDDAQLRALGKVIGATRNELFWYCRPHPNRPADGPRMERCLREGIALGNPSASRGALDVDVENATALPLYALLRHMSLHVTETSTTVIEASAFGVPTVLWGTLEAPSFMTYIASGMAKAAAPDEVPDALRAQLAAKARLPRPPRVDPAGLGELLALASRPVAARPPRA